jgi:Na+-driven multidrug efflux pump
VSAIIAGRLLTGAALSVIGVALPVYYAYAALGAMVGVGATAVCANLIGQREFAKVHQTYTLSYILLFLFAIALTLPILMFTDPVLRLLGATPDIFAETKEYVSALGAGGVLVMLVYPAYNLLRFDGRNFAAAAVFFMMAGLNILLDFVFLLGLKSGVSGIAVAMVLSSGAAGIFGNALLLKKSENLKIARPEPGSIGLARRVIWAGSPSAMEYLCFLLTALFINNILSSRFGSSALSVFKVVDSVDTFSLAVIWAIAGPLVTFAGVFLAERDTSSVKQLLTLAFKWGGPIVLAITVCCFVFSTRVAALFGVAGPAAQAAVRIFSLHLPMSLLLNIVIYLYMANHRAALANLIIASKFILVVAFASPLTNTFGLTGVWHSFWISEVITILLICAVGMALCRKNKDLTRFFLIDLSAERQGAYKAFIVPATYESISECAAGILDFSEANALSAGEAMRISLALEELLVVITENCKPDHVNVRILIIGDTIIISLRNTGAKFNPVEYARNAEGDKEMDVMGINIILKLAVSVDYRNTFGVNNNIIVLRKNAKK